MSDNVVAFQPRPAPPPQEPLGRRSCFIAVMSQGAIVSAFTLISENRPKPLTGGGGRAA